MSIDWILWNVYKLHSFLPVYRYANLIWSPQHNSSSYVFQLLCMMTTKWTVLNDDPLRNLYLLIILQIYESAISHFVLKKKQNM